MQREDFRSMQTKIIKLYIEQYYHRHVSAIKLEW